MRLPGLGNLLNLKIFAARNQDYRMAAQMEKHLLKINSEYQCHICDVIAMVPPPKNGR